MVSLMVLRLHTCELYAFWHSSSGSQNSDQTFKQGIAEPYIAFLGRHLCQFTFLMNAYLRTGGGFIVCTWSVRTVFRSSERLAHLRKSLRPIWEELRSVCGALNWSRSATWRPAGASAPLGLACCSLERADDSQAVGVERDDHHRVYSLGTETVHS